MLGNNTKTRIPDTLWSNDRFGFNSQELCVTNSDDNDKS